MECELVGAQRTRLISLVKPVVTAFKEKPTNIIYTFKLAE